MGNLGELCRKAVDTTPGALACGVVDLKTARMGMHHTFDRLAKEVLNAAARSIVAMFRDNPLLGLEAALEDDGEPLAREMFVRSDRALYFLKAVPERGVVFALMAQRLTDHGRAWHAVRQAVAAFKLSEGLESSRPLSAFPAGTGGREPTLRMKRPTLRSSKPLPRRPAHPPPEPPRTRPKTGHGKGSRLADDHPAIQRGFPSIGGDG